MRNLPSQFVRWILPLICVVLFVATGLIWKRSRHTADYCYQLRAMPEQSVLRGFGSYEGALVLGSVSEVGQPPIAPGIQHGKLKLTTGAGGQSILKLKPSYKTGSLGFGLSAGSVSLNLPMAFLLPTFRYHVLYIPYYLFMIVFAVPPARLLWLARSALPTRMFRTRLNSKALLPA